ncbi:Uncharacterised protein [Enterobacter hormaechei]|nr:Uncharacterised protein [Enterobacter hormaechei]
MMSVSEAHRSRSAVVATTMRRPHLIYRRLPAVRHATGCAPAPQGHCREHPQRCAGSYSGCDNPLHRSVHGGHDEAADAARFQNRVSSKRPFLREARARCVPESPDFRYQARSDDGAEYVRRIESASALSSAQLFPNQHPDLSPFQVWGSRARQKDDAFPAMPAPA